MGVALLIAVIVGLFVQMKLASKEKNQNVAVSGVEILVANKALMTGAVLKATDVRWESLPDNAVFNGVIKKSDQADENKMEIYGKPLKRNIESGEPVTMQAVLMNVEGSGNFLAASIAPGMRAVSLAIKAETSAGGFVTPGDHVDVLMTYQMSMKGDASDYAAVAIQKYASETVLSNVRVLAVDQNAKENGHEPKVAKTVTVEVSKEGAQILAMAAGMGTISISLRRLGEKDTMADRNTPLTTDVTTSKVIQKIYNIMNQSITTTNTVRLYKGSDVENVPVRALSGER